MTNPNPDARGFLDLVDLICDADHNRRAQAAGILTYRETTSVHFLAETLGQNVDVAA